MTYPAPSMATLGQIQLRENQTSIQTISASDDMDSVGSGLFFSISAGVDASKFVIDASTGALSFIDAPDYEAPADADHDNVYEATVRVTDSDGLYSEALVSVAVTDSPTLQIVISDGQSLSQGTTAANQVYSSRALYPSTVLGMNFNGAVPMNTGWRNRAVDTTKFVGFAPLVETTTETHGSGMMNALVSDYYSHGLTPPTFLHMNVGLGSKSILELMTGKDHTYASLTDAMNNVADGDVFAVKKDTGTFDFYLRSGSTASFYGNLPGPLLMWDNFVIQFKLAVDYGRSQGYEISPTPIFNWMQGQTDLYLGPPATGYGYVLAQLFERVNAAADRIIGQEADVLGVVSQVRGGRYRQTGIDQLDYVLANPNVTFGVPEYQLQAEFPSVASASGGDYTHLTPEGYYLYGQTLGHKVFDLISGQENTPLLIDKVTQTAPNSLLVHFSGVDQWLVDDPSIYRAANFIKPPPNMGFGVYRSDGVAAASFAVASASIVGPDTVKLDFSTALNGQFRLYLGRTEDNLGGPTLTAFGGSTLRDATTIAALAPTSGATLRDPFIYEYAPIQYVTLTANTAPVLQSPRLISLAENTSVLIDLAASDDASSEGQGIAYAITGGVDAQRFTIDPTTGVLSFVMAPDFENPADADHNNSYLVTVSVSDSIGAVSSYSLTANVTNTNEAPTSIQTTGLSVAANEWAGMLVGSVSGFDPDAGSVLQYALLDDFNGTFAIQGSTGDVTLKSSAGLAGMAGQTLLLPIQITDAGGLSFIATVPVAVTPPNANVFVGSDSDDTAIATAAGWRADGRGGDDRLTGFDAADFIYGGLGNDLLEGRGGADVLDGGAGIDTASYAASSAAVQVSLATGLGSGGDAQGDRLSGIEKLIGSAYSDGLTGDGGDNTLNGGPGNDVLDGLAGIDTADYSDAAAAVTVSLLQTIAQDTKGAGKDTLRNIENLTGSAFNDVLTGSNSANLLDGGNGNDMLTGNAGADVLVGGAGADTLNGGADNDQLFGGSGADRLDGGTGADLLAGGADNDSYTVDNAGDVVDETNGSGGDAGGLDSVSTSISYALTGLAAYVENLTLSGTAAIDGTGNDLANVLTGNAAANLLDGGNGNDVLNGNAGNDVLIGGAGNDMMNGGADNDQLFGGTGADRLDGGTGADLLAGGADNDSYTVDNAGDVVDETNGSGGDAGGLDSVSTSISYALTGFAAYVENLTLSGTAAIDATGNDLANVLTGNAAANLLDGGNGNDVLNGNAGSDVLIGGAGNDMMNGGADNDQLFGGTGADRLDGGTGADLLAGGADNDSYTVDNAGDVVDETNGSGGDAGGLDSVSTSISYALTGLAAYVENLTLGGTAAIDAIGNDLANVLTGNAAANLLDGGNGNDVLNGNAGSDVLLGGAGNDMMNGGADNDQLFGGTGADRLDGGTGADVLAGGADNDSYTVDNAGDVIDETNGLGGDAGGLDTVTTSISYALTGLAAYVENLTLSGTAAIDGIGNDLANVLTGNAAANLLDGGNGNDALNGGIGSDLLIGGAGADRLSGGADADTFVFGPGFGKDTITDFTVAATGRDTLRLSLGTAFDSYAEVMAVAVQSGANTMLNFGPNDTIMLMNVSKTALLTEHFVFG